MHRMAMKKHAYLMLVAMLSWMMNWTKGSREAIYWVFLLNYCIKFIRKREHAKKISRDSVILMYRI